ncbi:MAG: CGCAxxGCC family protein [Bacillota bacterium]|nr:MAG: CGCAxxGCC family protein [Bacillota bacterium]
MTKTAADKAKEFYLDDGYNCAEASWLGLSQDLDKKEQALGVKMVSGFGGGATVGSLCGALSGAIMGIGRWYGRELGGPRSEEAKNLTKALVDAFVAEYGSLDCQGIKPKSDDYRTKCAEYVAFAVRKAEELMDQGASDDDCG